MLSHSHTYSELYYNCCSFTVHQYNLGIPTEFIGFDFHLLHQVEQFVTLSRRSAGPFVASVAADGPGQPCRRLASLSSMLASVGGDAR